MAPTAAWLIAWWRRRFLGLGIIVRCIEACSLEVKAYACAGDALHGVFSTFFAGADRVIADFLKLFKPVLAFAASVNVGRHKNFPCKSALGSQLALASEDVMA